MKKPHMWTCLNCGKEFFRYTSQIANPDRTFCSTSCHGAWMKEECAVAGEKNPAWKGGKTAKKKCRCGKEMDARSHECRSCHESAAAEAREKLPATVAASSSVAEVARKLNRRPGPTGRMIKEEGLDTSHFRIQRFEHTPEDVFVRNSRERNRTCRRLALKWGLLEYKCAACGLGPEWHGKELVLELHHKNSDHHDNRIENLEFRCPNCHVTAHRGRGR